MQMISRGNIWRFVAVATLTLALQVVAHAHGGEPAGGPRGDLLPPHLGGLNLSEAQRDKIFEIMHAQVPVLRDKGKVVQKAEADLRALVQSPEYTEAKARLLLDGVARSMAELSLAHIKSERQIYELLTPEQRKQLAARKPPMEGPGGHHPGAHGDACMPPNPNGR